MKYCCEFMEAQLTHTCEQCGDGRACPDVIIEISRAQFHEGTLTLIGRNADYECNYCPICGTKWIREKFKNKRSGIMTRSYRMIQGFIYIGVGLTILFSFGYWWPRWNTSYSLWCAKRDLKKHK